MKADWYVKYVINNVDCYSEWDLWLSRAGPVSLGKVTKHQGIANFFMFVWKPSLNSVSIKYSLSVYQQLRTYRDCRPSASQEERSKARDSKPGTRRDITKLLEPAPNIPLNVGTAEFSAVFLEFCLPIIDYVKLSYLLSLVNYLSLKVSPKFLTELDDWWCLWCNIKH